MSRGTSRCGFTLVELMLAVMIFVIVLAALGSSFVGGVRLLKATLATTETGANVPENPPILTSSASCA